MKNSPIYRATATAATVAEEHTKLNTVMADIMMGIFIVIIPFQIEDKELINIFLKENAQNLMLKGNDERRRRKRSIPRNHIHAKYNRN